MIITLKGANFSTSNIGTLSSWRIIQSLGAGASYSGANSVNKGASFSATITIDSAYELGDDGVTVTMGGQIISAATISGNTITINISKVTGNVVIVVPTVKVSTGEEEEPEEPDTPVDGNDLTSLFTFNRDKWMLVSNPQWKSSSNFMSCFTDLSAYVGKTIEITIPQYTASNGASSTGMTAWCSQPTEEVSSIHTRVKVWDTDTNGNGKGVLVPIQTVVPAEAPYLWTSTYMVGVAAYVGPNDGLTDFYCKIVA